MAKNYVFLTECADFSEAQVVKSFLVSMYLHPRVRDEQMRAIAPHLGDSLGKLIMEIPEDEFMKASQALEQKQDAARPPATSEEEKIEDLIRTQGMARKALWNSVLGCILIPLLCNLFSMILGYRVLKQEKPLSALSRRRLLIAIVFNSAAFFFWLTIGPHFLTGIFRG